MYPLRQTYRQDADTYIENRGYAHRVRRGEPGFELLDDAFGAMLAPGQTATPAGEGWQLEEGAAFLEAMLAPRRAAIDAQTSARIMAGFYYELNGRRLRFSYDSFDQQNFADTANACLLAQLNPQSALPQTVNWNAYDAEGNLVRVSLNASEFLKLYTDGALAHKAACMEAGGAQKADLAPVCQAAPEDWWLEEITAESAAEAPEPDEEEQAAIAEDIAAQKMIADGGALPADDAAPFDDYLYLD